MRRSYQRDQMSAPSPYILPQSPNPFPATETHHQIGPDTTVTKPTYQVDPLDALKSRQDITDDEKRLADEQAKRQAALDEAANKAAEEQERARLEAMEKSHATIDEWKTRLDSAREQYDKQPFPALFADQESGKRAMLGIGLAVAAFASATAARANAMLGGQGRGPDYVGDIIDADIARQKDKIKGLSDRVVMAKTGLGEAHEARRIMLAEVDAKGLAMAERAKRLAESNLLSQGLSKADVEKHAAYIAADKKSQEYKEHIAGQAAESISKNYQADTVTTRTTDPTAKAPTPTGADVDAVNQVEAGIAKADRLLAHLEKNPSAWGEYRDNQERWQRREAAKGNAITNTIRTTFQVGGLADIAPEQGLKTADGKAVHQGMSELRMLLAKEGGGVVTEPDRNDAGTRLASLALSPDEAKATIQRVRETLARSRDAYIKNRGVVPGSALTAPPAPPNVGNPPPPSPSGAGNSLVDLGAPPADLQTMKLSGKVGGNAPHSNGPDIRRDPSSWPGPSAPPGPPEETPLNSPDNPNSEAPLPEDPTAPSIDDFQGRASAGQTARPSAPATRVAARPPAAAPVAPVAGPALTARQRIVEMLRANPELQNQTILRRYNITPEELR